MDGLVKKWKIKKALSSDGGISLTAKKARNHAQKAKGALASHKKRKKGYHNKMAIRVDN